MEEEVSIFVGIGKRVRGVINHQWFVGIAAGIIAGLLYFLLERPHILVVIYRIVRGYITMPWVILTACVVVGVLLYFLYRRGRTHITEDHGKGEGLKEGDRREVMLSPQPGLCLGRDTELAQLENDIEHKNIVLIKGIAGIGKTTLGLKLKDNLEKKGYKTFWSQISYNSYEGFLSELSEYLTQRGSVYAGQIMREAIPEKRFKIAVQALCDCPTVVFLDDFQKLENDSDFKVFRNYLKKSTVVIMSREQPTFLLEDYENLSYLDRHSSVTLLTKLGLKEPEAMLEKIFEKTKGHPWSLECFVKFSYNFPPEKLFSEIPDFGREQQTYINEQCWNALSKDERDFLMRASVFTKPLHFDALEVCSSDDISKVVMSLAQSFFIRRRGEYYYIHDIIRDFAFSELEKDERLYGEAQRKAAAYYRRNVYAENILLAHYHLRKAGEYREGIELIVYNIEYFWREGFWLDVKRVLEESLEFFDDEMIAGICSSLGTIVAMLGDWDKALEYHQKHLEISETLGDMSGIAGAYGNLGGVYHDKGEWDKALEYHQKDLEISETLGDMSGIAAAYCNLGGVYHDKGEWDKALEYHQKDLEISETLGDMSGIAAAYCNLGLVYHAKGEWDKALEYHQKDLEISETLGDMSGIARACCNIGEVQFKKGEWDKAKEYYEKSLKILEELRDIYNVAHLYRNIGNLSFAKKEYEKALNWYLKASGIFEGLGAHHELRITKEKISHTNKTLEV